MTRIYRMRFVTLVLALVLLMAMMLTGCGDQKELDATKAPTDIFTEASTTESSVMEFPTEAPTDVIETEASETDIPTESVESTEFDATEPVGQLSDDPFSFQIYIDGTVIQLPCNAADFAVLGWNMKAEKAESPLADGYTTSVNIYHEDGSYMTLSIYNISGEAVNFADAMVDDVSVHGMSVGEHQIFISNGLMIGSTKDAVIAVYGNEPSYDYVSEDGSYSKLEYEFDNFRNKIVFSFTDDVVSEIDINTAG